MEVSCKLLPCCSCSFAFNNVAPDDVIEFNVYDHNRLRKDSLMGTGSLSMRQVRLCCLWGCQK